MLKTITGRALCWAWIGIGLIGAGCSVGAVAMDAVATRETVATTTGAVQPQPLRADQLSTTALQAALDRLPAEVIPTGEPPGIDWRCLKDKLRLDRRFFSPTIVDDLRWTPLYRQAVKNFQRAKGLTIDGIVGPITDGVLGDLTVLTTQVVLRAEDFAALTPLPDGYEEMARRPWLGYSTLLELLAERYHTSESFLERLNPQVTWLYAAPGLKISVPRIRRRIPDFRAARVEVDIARFCVLVYDSEGELRASFNCSIGMDREVYNGLSLVAVNQAEWPNYTLAPELFGLEEQISGKLLLPPGPNNPVGRAWVGLSQAGYGIHGTPAPETIGRARSHGCIRLSNWDAWSFAHMIVRGVPVVFVDSDRREVKSSLTTDSLTGGTLSLFPQSSATAPSVIDALTSAPNGLSD